MERGALPEFMDFSHCLGEHLSGKSHAFGQSTEEVSRGRGRVVGERGAGVSGEGDVRENQFDLLEGPRQRNKRKKRGAGFVFFRTVVDTS